MIRRWQRRMSWIKSSLDHRLLIEQGQAHLACPKPQTDLWFGVLETTRLTIRPFRPDDLEATAEIWNYPDAERKDLLEWTMAEYRLLSRLHQPPYGDRGVELKATGKLVGSVGLVPCLNAFGLLPGFYETTGQPEATCSTTEMGLYWEFAPQHRRQGYATEAGNRLIDYAFRTLRLERIIAETDHDNLASQGVMRRLGMQIYLNPHPEPPWLQVVGLLKNPNCRIEPRL
jgi:ribosomal-protein-alanine N-acetyltransferase